LITVLVILLICLSIMAHMHDTRKKIRCPKRLDLKSLGKSKRLGFNLQIQTLLFYALNALSLKGLLNFLG